MICAHTHTQRVKGHGVVSYLGTRIEQLLEVDWITRVTGRGVQGDRVWGASIAQCITAAGSPCVWLAYLSTVLGDELVLVHRLLDEDAPAGHI